MAKRSQRTKITKAPRAAAGARQSPIGPGGMAAAAAGATARDQQGQTTYDQLAGPPPPATISDINQGSNAWSPLQPVNPFGPPSVNYPRTFDYPIGYNLDMTGHGRLTFMKMLQILSRSWGILRAVIETRKDQLMRIPWDVQIKDSPKKTDKRLDELRAFFKRPDRKNGFNAWARMQLEDLFVTDTANYFVWKNNGGKPYALMHLAGETVKPLVDDSGQRPDWPNPAYQQIIKGMPWQNLDEREFVYAPMRPTPQEPVYGYSPVQQIYIEVLQGIKKALYKLSYWEDGSIPQILMTVPDGWTPQQMAAFQAHLDYTLGGEVRMKSRIQLMPSNAKPFDLKNANGELLKTEEDEWVTRLVCYAFSVSPQPFMNQMNRATAETAVQEAQEEGLHPLMTWFKEELMDRAIQDPGLGFGYDDIEFVWMPEPEVDPNKQMAVITGYVDKGLMTIDEGREQINLPPLPNGAGSEAVVMTASGPVPVHEQLEANRAGAVAAKKQAEAPPPDPALVAAGGAAPAAPAAPGKKVATARGVAELEKILELVKYNENQPRAEDGKWTSGGGWGGEIARRFSTEWSVNSKWEELQHAARAVVGGLPRDKYICYDCKGDDRARYDLVSGVISQINDAPTLDRDLYRGIRSSQSYAPGDRFSESLASWTGSEELAREFATGVHGDRGFGDQLRPLEMRLAACSNPKALNLPPDSTFAGVDEWIASGEYEVTSVSGDVVNVKRVGPARSENLKKFDEARHPRADDGKWTSGASASARAAAVAASDRFAAAVSLAADGIKRFARDPDNVRELVARASTAVLYHGFQADMPADLEHAVRSEIKLLSTNAGVSYNQAKRAVAAAFSKFRGGR